MTVTSLDTLRGAPALPRVNLLPPEIAEGRRLHQAKLVSGLGLLGCVALVGVLYASARGSVASAQTALTDAQAERTRVQTQVSALRGVSATFAQLAGREALLTSTMGDEVQWSHYLNDLALTIPSNLWMKEVTISQAAAASAPRSGGSQTPLVDPGIGTVTFVGYALSHDDVAVWLETLAKQKGYANAYFTSSTEEQMFGKTVYQFTSTVTVTADALSGRYSKPGRS